MVTSCNHVRYVVMEYGVADLYGKSIRQRAEQLINLANPDFRLNLARQAKESHYLQVGGLHPYRQNPCYSFVSNSAQ